MDLSPDSQERLLQIMAERLVNEIRHEVGDLSSLVVLPVDTVARFAGISSARARSLFPITQTTKGKHGVTVKAYKDFLLENTAEPKPTSRVFA